MIRRIGFAGVVWLGCLLTPLHGQERDDEKAELLPPPRRVLVAPPAPLLPPPPAPLSPNETRYVWRNYAVSEQGYWRPRVILSPYGSYYYANGYPYPWLTTHPRSFRTYVTD